MLFRRTEISGEPIDERSRGRRRLLIVVQAIATRWRRLIGNGRRRRSVVVRRGRTDATVVRRSVATVAAARFTRRPAANGDAIGRKPKDATVFEAGIGEAYFQNARKRNGNPRRRVFDRVARDIFERTATSAATTNAAIFAAGEQFFAATNVFGFLFCAFAFYLRLFFFLFFYFVFQPFKIDRRALKFDALSPVDTDVGGKNGRAVFFAKRSALFVQNAIRFAASAFGDITTFAFRNFGAAFYQFSRSANGTNDRKTEERRPAVGVLLRRLRGSATGERRQGEYGYRCSIHCLVSLVGESYYGRRFVLIDARRRPALGLVASSRSRRLGKV